MTSQSSGRSAFGNDARCTRTCGSSFAAALASASFEIRRETADERRRAAARRDRARNRNRLFRGNDESSEDLFFASVSSSGSDARAADDLAVASATWARLEVAAPTKDDELFSRGGAESRGGVSAESRGGVSASSEEEAEKKERAHCFGC